MNQQPEWVGLDDARRQLCAVDVIHRHEEPKLLELWCKAGQLDCRCKSLVIGDDPRAFEPVTAEMWQLAAAYRDGVNLVSGILRFGHKVQTTGGWRTLAAEARGLEFRREQLDRLTGRVPATQQPATAKAPHPSSLIEADAPLLDEMRRIIDEGKATGPNPAALIVVDRAQGAGTVESKVRRLERRYIETFGE